MKIKTGIRLLCILAALVLLAGCGAGTAAGSGSDTTGAQSPAASSQSSAGAPAGSAAPSQSPGAAALRYGVFIGADAEDTAIMQGYEQVVIDAAYYTQQQVEALQTNGAQVYSYLNIGSIETFREEYPQFEGLILDEYENWPGEYWVDVASAEWQQCIAGAAKALADKGVDGFFIDNADVYYQYPRDAIYEGLRTMLSEMGTYGKPILINGGDAFVTRAVLEAMEPLAAITGVNQECVFTNIDFENETLTLQDAETTAYYKAYIEHCAAAGLAVYLTEYADSNAQSPAADIEAYCRENGFSYFISPSVNLDGV